MKFRCVGWAAALVAAMVSGAASAQAPAIDVASIVIPDLTFVPTGTDLQKYPRNFFAYKRGVSFETALAELRACENISALQQTPFSFAPAFVAYGPGRTGKPEIKRREIPGGILVGLSDGLVSRNFHLANRRECLMYRGYTLYGVTSAAWEAIEANGQEGALRIRAKLASGPQPVQPVAYTPVAAYSQLAPLPAAAPQIVHARKPGAVTLDPAQAYILVRFKTPKGAVPYGINLVRELTQRERDDYENARSQAIATAKRPDRFTFVYEAMSNVVSVWANQRFAESGDERFFLLPVPPGTYLVAGMGNLCLCMGSVAFEAKAGQITDMGYYFVGRITRPSEIPELAPLVNRPKLLSHNVFIQAFALRPHRDDMPVPEELKGLPRVAADYHAVGELPNLFGVSVARLAPVPGVLSYDGGRVIDARTGRELPPSD